MASITLGCILENLTALGARRGYTVTATVRSQAKANDIIETHPSWKKAVKFVIVADFTSQGPFDDIFRNSSNPFDYVIHTASPLKFQVSDIQKEMIEPAEKGTTEILRAAHHFGGPSLRRFVLRGSAVSATAEQAIARNDTVLGYNVSNTRAEAAAWQFTEKAKPGFDLTGINPDIITGPMIHPIHGPKSINETNHFAIASFIDGTHKRIEGVTFLFYHFVDVRDVARSHVDALKYPAAANQRVLLIAGLISPQLVVNTIRQNFPSLEDRVPEGNPSQVLPSDVHPTGWDTRISLDILAKGSRDGR
ncbi:hypothetical protein AnigIFM50267_006735 [Aspergillus niger]|nr:hypothetical protein AnigIFM50267_006735 [Aspergillus niger]GLA19277.1 hypothetical protein AnigIFM62618_006946 [Aspergillus niger]